MKYLHRKTDRSIVPVWDMHHYIMAVTFLDMRDRVHDDPPDRQEAWRRVQQPGIDGRHALLIRGIPSYYSRIQPLYLNNSPERYGIHFGRPDTPMHRYVGWTYEWGTTLSSLLFVRADEPFGLVDLSYQALRRGNTVLVNGTQPYKQRAEQDAALLATLLDLGQSDRDRVHQVLARLGDIKQPWWKEYGNAS